MSEDIPYHLRPGAKQRRVVCAANRWGSRIVIGPRHYDPIMRAQIETNVALARHPDMEAQRWRGAEQGFIDQWGTFMDRKEAFAVAQAAGQLLYGPHLPDGELDSSDLY